MHWLGQSLWGTCGFRSPCRRCVSPGALLWCVEGLQVTMPASPHIAAGLCQCMQHSDGWMAALLGSQHGCSGVEALCTCGNSTDRTEDVCYAFVSAGWLEACNSSNALSG